MLEDRGQLQDLLSVSVAHMSYVHFLSWTTMGAKWIVEAATAVLD